MAEKFTIDDFAEESFSSAPKQKFTIDDFAEESFLSAPQPAPQQKFTIDDFAENLSPLHLLQTPHPLLMLVMSLVTYLKQNKTENLFFFLLIYFGVLDRGYKPQKMLLGPLWPQRG